MPLVTLLQSSYSSPWIADRLVGPCLRLCATHRQRQNRRRPCSPVHKLAAPRVASCMQSTPGELCCLGHQRTAAAGGFAGPALCAVQLRPSRNPCSCKIVGIWAAIHAGIATRRHLSSGDPILCRPSRGVDRAARVFFLQRSDLRQPAKLDQTVPLSLSRLPVRREGGRSRLCLVCPEQQGQ